MSPRPRSAPHRHDRRTAILDAAADLFAVQGFDATTMQDIADRVGMLKGSLYYYIRSKQALLYEIIFGTHERFRHNLETVQNLPLGTLARIWGFVYANVTGNAVSLAHSSVFFSEFRSLEPDDRETIVRLRDTHDHVLRNLLASGQGEGVVRPDLDVKLTATAVLTMCNSLYLWYRPGGDWRPEDVARRYADLVVASVASRRAKGGAAAAPVDAEALATLMRSAPLEGVAGAGIVGRVSDSASTE